MRLPTFIETFLSRTQVINFLRVGNFLLVPQIGIASDTVAIEQLKEIYRDCEVVPCEAKGIVAKGGAFNCVSWNIKE